MGCHDHYGRAQSRPGMTIGGTPSENPWLVSPNQNAPPRFQNSQQSNQYQPHMSQSQLFNTHTSSRATSAFQNHVAEVSMPSTSHYFPSRQAAELQEHPTTASGTWVTNSRLTESSSKVSLPGKWSSSKPDAEPVSCARELTREQFVHGPGSNSVPNKSSQSEELEASLQRVRGLELQVKELETKNQQLENEIDQVGTQLLDTIHRFEELQMASEEKVAQLELEQYDMVQQNDEFEREKEEELRDAREKVALLTRQVEDLNQEREDLVDSISSEGQELQYRNMKLTQERDAFRHDLEALQARSERFGGNDIVEITLKLEQCTTQLQEAMRQRESLKNTATINAGKIKDLETQLDSANIKLKLADMTNEKLNAELGTLRQNMSQPFAHPSMSLLTGGDTAVRPSWRQVGASVGSMGQQISITSSANPT